MASSAGNCSARCGPTPFSSTPHGGAVVDRDALVDVLRQDRIRAVLDVTDPDRLPAGHPLWDCDNALMTPHFAGSQGNEWRRPADLAVDEVARWAAGDGFTHPVPRERVAFLA